MQFGFTDILELVGALGLFLFGMKVMSDALLELAGNRMRSVLAGMTSNRFKGITTGFLITSIIQSSSATTLMVVSFANASLLSLTQAISVIMGANIGTTLTAWLITLLGFQVSMSAIALPVIGLGFGFAISRNRKWREIGTFIVGFGLLFVGLDFLRDALPDIDGSPEMLYFLRDYSQMAYGSVLLFLLIGTLLTVLLQSSSATMALTLVMTAEGWIPYELAAALVLGENIGTTITANLAAFVGNYRAKQTALAHLVFNLFGVLWMLLVLHPFLQAIAWGSQKLGSASPYLSAAAIPVAISLFHSSFNICNTFFLVWLVRPIARLISRLVPERLPPEKAIEEPKFLNEQALRYPQTAIASLEQESRYLYEYAIFEIVAHALHLHRGDILSEKKPDRVVSRSREDLKTDVRALYLSRVKRIYSLIIAYATRAQSNLHLSERQHRRVAEIKVANRKMVEVIRDATELNRNVSLYLGGEYPVMAREYDKFRKKMIRVLRVIQAFQTEKDTELYYGKMRHLAQDARDQIEVGNRAIDGLIRKEAITPEMATSLLNDSDNLNDMIQNLIMVAELLYGHKDRIEIAAQGANTPDPPAMH